MDIEKQMQDETAVFTLPKSQPAEPAPTPAEPKPEAAAPAKQPAPVKMPAAPGTAPARKPAAPGTAPARKPAAPGTAPARKPAAPGTAPARKPAAPGTAPARKPAAPGTAPARKPAAPGTAPARKPAAPGAVPAKKPAAPQKPLPAALQPRKEKKVRKPIPASVTAVTAVLSLVLCLTMLFRLGASSGSRSTAAAADSGVNLMNKFDSYMTNQVSSALDGILSITKHYWLSDSDMVAPKPNPEGYGETTDPTELGWLVDKATETFGGEKLLFTTDTEIWDKSSIHYYYDETILSVSWKQVIDRAVYTFAEVKIAHPSQFRRFLADGTFGSDKQYTTTDMASSVNAVLASSGDFYKFRRNGAMVYQGQLMRFEGYHVDTCFIDDNGDLLFKYRQELKSEADAQAFIDENNIRFSLAFGPVMIDKGENKVPASYALGEIKNRFSRTALCQIGPLHYLLVNCGGDGGANDNRHPLKDFTNILIDMGVQTAYSLDGGQTAVLAMDGELVNRPDYGTQRKISDIIYFATAIPEGG